MHLIDWIILLTILAVIVGYGMYKTREVTNSQSYFIGNKDLKWWTIGLSVMATQASAITFLSTPGQAFDDGMRFAQFYIGLPIAMVILCIWVLPRYYKSNVVTAYEYLEQRFDLKTRTLTSVLFLIQRGLAAGLTIFAPSIILSTILGWNLQWTTIIIGILVILYTVLGGAVAVSQTQKQQMIVILGGMFVAFLVIVSKLPPDISLGNSLDIAGKMGKLQVIDWKWDLSNKYNVWSGILAGTFLFLSYFGTDQSQVQRYLSGKTLTESRLGLLFNGIFKVPMQISILLVGIMVFMFYQFNPAPLHFNNSNVEIIKQSSYANEYIALEQAHSKTIALKKDAIYDLDKALKTDTGIGAAQAKVQVYVDQEKSQKSEVALILDKMNEEDSGLKLEKEDTDYVFITFITNNLPTGLVGLLLAVILAAAMSSTSAELNALATCTVSDIYRRNFNPNQEDGHYLKVAKWTTALWGVIALIFASFASLFDNLIEAVNMIGYLFYGVILGVFALAFFFKHIRGNAVFIAAIIGECIVLVLFYLEKTGVINLAYLWLNAIGCLIVIILAHIFHFLLPQGKETIQSQENG